LQRAGKAKDPALKNPDKEQRKEHRQECLCYCRSAAIGMNRVSRTSSAVLGWHRRATAEGVNGLFICGGGESAVVRGL
jgi:hypothetical protein